MNSYLIRTKEVNCFDYFVDGNSEKEATTNFLENPEDYIHN